MTPDEFVDALKVAVHESAIQSLEASLREPTGRRPPSSVASASQWFKNLKKDEQDIVLGIIKRSVHATMFGLFAVLDGVRPIENRSVTGKLILSLEDSNGAVRLNSERGDMLHEIYQAKVYEDIFGKKTKPSA